MHVGRTLLYWGFFAAVGVEKLKGLMRAVYKLRLKKRRRRNYRRFFLAFLFR